jgi:hypothetical protein
VGPIIPTFVGFPLCAGTSATLRVACEGAGGLAGTRLIWCKSRFGVDLPIIEERVIMLCRSAKAFVPSAGRDFALTLLADATG